MEHFIGIVAEYPAHVFLAFAFLAMAKGLVDSLKQ